MEKKYDPSATDTVANSEHCNYGFSFFFNNDSPKIEDIPRVRLMNRVNLADTVENDILVGVYFISSALPLWFFASSVPHASPHFLILLQIFNFIVQ